MALLGKKSDAEKAAKAAKAAEKKADSRHELIDSHPYEFTPSFVHHNGRVSTLVQLYVRSGSNSMMSFQDVIDLVPVDTLSDVTVHFLEFDAVVKDDEKKKLIRSNAVGGRQTIEQNRRYDAQHADNIKMQEDKSTMRMKDSDMADYNAYELILDSAEPVVIFKLQLLITGPTQDAVEEQLAQLNTLLDQRHEGARWDSLAGAQYDDYTRLFEPLQKDRFSMTSTASNYAGINFAVSAGLADERGVPIGFDSLSLTGSTAIFDFERSLKKFAVITMPASSTMSLYHMDELENRLHVSSSSLLAQCAANQISLYGHRVCHFVLNDFDYFEDGRYYRPRETQSIFERYDVSQVTINPLQGFGEVSDVVSIFSRLVNKIVNIFDLLEDLKLTTDEKAIVLKSVEDFYFHHQLWTQDAAIYPKRTRIVGITNPETYPTMGVLINEFTSLAQAAARQNRELKADKVDTLQSILSQSLSTYMNVLGRPTSITTRRALQTYYEFRNIASQPMLQVQFINCLDYALHHLEKDDVFIVHSCDKLYKTTLDMAKESIDAAQRRGVRVIFTYDTVSATPSRVDVMSDMFSGKGVYYVDFDSDVDFSFTGRLTPEEVDRFENALNMSLSAVIKSQLAVKLPCQALCHRAADATNNFVHLSVLI